MSQSFRFYVRPAPGERVETHLKLPEEISALLVGSVSAGTDDAPLHNAAAVLSDADTGQILMQTCTDEDGRFLFGPLEPNRLYAVQVFHGTSAARMLDLSGLGGGI